MYGLCSYYGYDLLRGVGPIVTSLFNLELSDQVFIWVFTVITGTAAWNFNKLDKRVENNGKCIVDIQIEMAKMVTSIDNLEEQVRVRNGKH